MSTYITQPIGYHKHATMAQIVADRLQTQANNHFFPALTLSGRQLLT